MKMTNTILFMFANRNHRMLPNCSAVGWLLVAGCYAAQIPAKRKKDAPKN